MKAFYLLLLIICISVSTESCFFSKSIVISFENNSDKFIDSVVVHIQNYKFSFKNVNPNSKTSKKILKDSIILNKHDVMIHAYMYDKEKSNFKGGFYYTDLSGSLYNNYTILLDKDLNTTIK